MTRLWPACPLGQKPPPRTVGQMTALAEVETNASEIDQSAGAIELNDTPGVASPQAAPERQIAGMIHDEGRPGKQFGHGNQHNTEFATVPLQRGIVQLCRLQGKPRWARCVWGCR